jgi:hypothetical protein
MFRFALVLLALTAAACAAPVPPTPVPSDEGERVLARGRRFAARGRIDLFVAATAAWKLKDDDLRMWEPAADLGRGLIEKAEMKGDRKPQETPSPYKDFATFATRFQTTFKRTSETYFRTDPTKAPAPTVFSNDAIQAPGVVDPAGITYCLILPQGDVQTATGITSSVVFANGDVTAKTILQSVVLVCDGDVTVTDRSICRSVVVARGNITAPSAGTVVLIAGGKVAVGNKEAIRVRKIDTILENQSTALGVTFFELSQVGLKVKAAGSGLAVDEVAARSAAEKAGLRAGDVVLEAKDKKPADAEGLRRLLRDALAVGDATVKVRRGDEALLLTLILPD